MYKFKEQPARKSNRAYWEEQPWSCQQHHQRINLHRQTTRRSQNSSPCEIEIAINCTNSQDKFGEICFMWIDWQMHKETGRIPCGANANTRPAPCRFNSCTRIDKINTISGWTNKYGLWSQDQRIEGKFEGCEILTSAARQIEKPDIAKQNDNVRNNVINGKFSHSNKTLKSPKMGTKMKKYLLTRVNNVFNNDAVTALYCAN